MTPLEKTIRHVESLAGLNKTTFQTKRNHLKYMWIQKEIQLEPKPRGFHLVTNEIIKELSALQTINTGIANIFAIFSILLSPLFL